VILPFPIFTRLCPPFVKVRYADHEYFEPDGDAVFLVDIGLRLASENVGVASMDYIKYVMHYSRKYVTLFVIPDVWRYERHINNANRFIQLARRLKGVDNMVPILVGHYFHHHINEYLELLNELSELFPTVLLGIPGNMVTASPRPFKCVSKPTVCNQYIASVVGTARKWGIKAHILGIGKNTLDFLTRNNIDGVVSADADKARASDGKKPHRREYCQVFRQWLGKYEQPNPSEWLLQLIQ
jgi:hypothetical protein